MKNSLWRTIVFNCIKWKKPFEKQLEAELVRRVKEAGGKAYKAESKMPWKISDRYIILQRQLWLVEINRPGGGQFSMLQKIFRTHGIEIKLKYFLVKNFEDIDKFFQEVEQHDMRPKA